MICCSPFSPDMMFTCSFLGWLLLPLSSRFSPLIKGSLIQPKHTPSMHQNQTQPQSIKIHVFTRPQTYNKQQACIRIQHIPNPCCTISARWKEWNWFFPPGAGVNSPPCAANQKSDATLVKIALVHILGFLWIKFYLWTHIPCVSDIWILVFCFLMMHITSNLLNKTSFE